MEPNLAINTSTTSCVLCKAQERLYSIIFNKALGSPRYHELSILSSISLIKITVGINDKLEKS